MVWVIRIILFLMPLLLFWIWLEWARRHPGREREITWMLVFLGIALSLVIGAGLVWTFGEDSHVTGRYVAPQDVDGTLVPGHFEEKPANP